MKFLFWNIKKNSVSRIVSEVARGHEIEVVILAECTDQEDILRELNGGPGPLFHRTDSDRTRVVLYTKFPNQFIVTEYHDSTLTIRRLILPGRREILLAAAHL